MTLVKNDNLRFGMATGRIGKGGFFITIEKPDLPLSTFHTDSRKPRALRVGDTLHASRGLDDHTLPRVEVHRNLKSCKKTGLGRAFRLGCLDYDSALKVVQNTRLPDRNKHQIRPIIQHHFGRKFWIRLLDLEKEIRAGITTLKRRDQLANN
jgi:hypothetical protein